jgi:hypothetical protein
MIKLLAITLSVASLAACSNMNRQPTAGNPAETKNSTDANKSGNKAAQSPGGAPASSGATGASGAGAAGTGTGTGTGTGGGAGTPSK